MTKFQVKIFLTLFFMLGINIMLSAKTSEKNLHETDDNELDIKVLILHHLKDAYEWHIAKVDQQEIAIPLPIIVYSNTKGLNVFMSSQFHEVGNYQGFSIAHEGMYEGKIVETDNEGIQTRPIDISLTKNAVSIIVSSILLLALILPVARSYKRNGYVPGTGYMVFMELFIADIYENVIKSSLGKHHKTYAPYLLTLFFFIFINNITGIIPLIPGGANVTGNISITFVLAFITFLIVNVKGSKEYWKEIFWPDVPWWLKFPIPVMPAIELVGIFMKPFALMIRLFANILAGHSVILALTCVIFVTVKMGVAVNSGMTVVAVIFSVFLGLVEFLVSYIQAYVFTLLTAIFINLARVEPHHKEEKSINIHQ